MEVGITSYGAYLPRLRITCDEYRKGWGSFEVGGLIEKTVPNFDEDTLTMGVSAGLNALDAAHIDPAVIAGLYLASTVLPYAEGAPAATAAAMLGLSSNIRLGQFGGSTNCGASALLAAFDYVASHDDDSAVLVIVTDVPRAVVGGRMEQAFGAGAAAFVVGKKNVLLALEGSHSVARESLGERFRLEGETRIRDIEVKPYTDAAYQSVSMQSAKGLMDSLSLGPEDVHYAAFQQFDVRSSMALGKQIGLGEEKIKPYMVFPFVGDVGAASCSLGLINLMDIAEPGERILTVSYGSGAESSAFSFVKRKSTNAASGAPPALNDYLADKTYIGFSQYLKITDALKGF